MDKLRVGVIGIGNIGTAHATRIANGDIKGMELSAVCDIDTIRLDNFRADGHTDIPVFDDYKKLISSGLVDAVIVSVPHRLHAEIAIFALESGLHVLTEKPEDISVSRAQMLNDKASKSGKVFAIMFNQRTNPLFIKAKEIIDSGTLGEMKRTVWIVTNWYRSQAYYNSGGWRATWSGEGGGVLLNQAVHNLDLWQWLCGMPKSVFASCETSKYHDIEVEDNVTINTFYENGATGCFMTSTIEYPGTNRLEISFERGKIVLENSTLKMWKIPDGEYEKFISTNEGFPTVDTEYSEFCSEDSGSAHAGILQNFCNSVLFGEKLISPGSEGINSLTLINAAYLSHWQQKKIELPFCRDTYDKELQKRIDNSEFNPDGSHKGKRDYDRRWNVRW